MINEILERLTGLLGPIATMAKERRELKDSALRAISNALDETGIYFRDLEHGSERNLDREALLVKYWSAAAIPIRHFDENLADLCEVKSEYWLNPDNYNQQEINQLGISLDNMRRAYKAHLRYTSSFGRR